MLIGFVGMGNMAKAMIGGIINKKIAEPKDIKGSARTKETCEAVNKEYQIYTTQDNLEVASSVDMLVLAVKPQMFGEVLPPLKNAIRKETIVVSIAAGKTLADLGGYLGGECKLVRLMPNTPALVGEGITAVTPNENVSAEELDAVLKIVESFGSYEIIPEKSMDAFCALAGSSPAYVFMYMEALADAGVKAGLTRDQAYRAVAQSTLGSARLMLETGKHPGVLKDMVCSPGGTTIEAVQVLEECGFRSAIMDAAEACVAKSKSLS